MSEPVMIGIREVYQAVTELGAKFDAFARSTALDVALLQQRVLNLEKEREGVVLRAGDLGVFDGRLATLHAAAVTDADTAFVNGRLVFEQAPMRTVADELKRWYGVTLRIDEKLASQDITASFKGESIQEVLNVIGLATGVGIELHGDTAVARTPR